MGPGATVRRLQGSQGAGCEEEMALSRRAEQPGVGCEEEMALSRRAEQPGWDVEKGRR